MNSEMSSDEVNAKFLVAYLTKQELTEQDCPCWPEPQDEMEEAQQYSDRMEGCVPIHHPGCPFYSERAAGENGLAAQP